MTGVAERVMVSFDGGGGGEGDLSWGQSEYWATISALEDWFPLGGVKPLPPGTSVEEIAEELRYLMSRYPPMRTKLRFDPAGRPSQQVYGTGTIALEVVDAGDADPDQVADAVAERYRTTDLDFATEWPVRMAVVRRGPDLTHMVVLMSHLTVDGTGGEIMMREVALRTDAPVPDMQPLAQVIWQQSSAGQRQNTAALRYCEGVFRTFVPDQFAGHGESRKPRYWRGELDSPALMSALDAIADSSGAESSTILLTLFAAAVHGLTGTNPVLLRPTIRNRFRSSLAGVVCTLAQAGYVVLDVADDSFPETLRRAQRSVIAAYKNAYCDPQSVAELKDRIAEERGTAIETAGFLNDRRSAQRDTTGIHTLRPPAAPPGTFRWLRSQDSPAFEKLLLEVDDAPGTVRVTLTLDTAFVSLAKGEALVRAMEGMAVAEAYTPTMPGEDPFPAIVRMLMAATGEGAEWAAGVKPDSRLEEHLRLESMEVLALGESMREQYGVDLPGHLARLEIDELIALTVGDLAVLCHE